MKWAPLFYPWIPLLVITGVSEILVQRGIIPKYLLPAPSEVIGVMVNEPSPFFTALLETAKASGLGLFLSIATGVGLALILSTFRLARLMFYPYAIFFQTVPIIAIAPLLVIWFGYGLSTVVAASFIVSVFPVIANSVTGLLGTDPLLMDLFRIFGAGRFQTLWRLRFPYALPQIFTGIKISAGLAVIGAIVGEFIAGSGLGGLVDTARNQQRVDRVFAAVLLASLLGVVFFGVISVLTRLVTQGRKGG